MVSSTPAFFLIPEYVNKYIRMIFKLSLAEHIFLQFKKSAGLEEYHFYGCYALFLSSQGKQEFPMDASKKKKNWTSITSLSPYTVSMWSNEENFRDGKA
jgi:hypothetical protein